ncbi:MAG TPA: PRC and DUF2382 domain-containing protein [Armatimonadota bacterium]|jgi:uncharacterized protein (TIGR02271 family)|nr:PRC and DUF2382 domain-containing protein [Armatimonadota bacterium]HOJ20193.1 PRC and DUF2382 domain-containing protein [Armatimonadota bacterium]HOM80707.1 PRC and DUF2382 domain-containing protein [Armatimonadota bacterium]HPO73053.1 PRC and DUF2382 domain-containing protein [Armatimonadota bacterium]HPT96237.1 PRC and DUF2382 domain-containing protein [Armatimonadota bacterium]
MANEMGGHQPYPLGEGDRFRMLREGTYRREELDLQRMEDLEHWTIAEGEPDIRGWDILTQEGDHVGKVHDLIASPKTQHVYFILAQIGGLWGMGGRHVLVPLDRIHLNRENHQVRIDAPRDRLENAIEWRAGEEIDYAGAYRYWMEEGMPGRAETHEMAGMRGGEVPAGETRVPLREEEMVATRQVHTGEIEVEKHVVSEQRTIEVPVSHTEVEVERRPVTGEARYHTEGEITEGEVRIPVREEEVHIEKRPVVKEEIIVRQHPETEMERRTETIRREVAEVHKEGDIDVETKGVDVETESNIDRSRRRTG